MHRLHKLVRTPLARKYEIIAFTTGFVLMAYELAASRILAPHIGSSTYVWTSVIGVIIAALSAGYAFGGTLADRRVAAQDIAWLLLTSALGVAVTLVLADGFLGLVSMVIGDPRLQGLIASVVLFMPASFVLGMISPYLVRLRNVALDTTGRAVASLSALNALGGIAGTFCVGFIFFEFIGSQQTLLLIICLLIGSSWLITPRTFWRPRLLSGGVIILLAAVQLFTPVASAIVADVDTPSARYTIVDTTTSRGRPLRILVTGPRGGQSGIYLDGSDDLAFPYLRQLAAVIQKQPHKANMLVLGGGAFTFPQYLANQYPQSHIDVVEVDPQLERIARQYFHYHDHANVTAISQDARSFLNQNTKHYDVIVVDVYNELYTPFTLATTEYAHELKRSLTSGGIVAANIIGSANRQCAPFLGSVHSSYRTAFRNYRIFPLGDPALQESQNMIAVYANHELSGLRDSPLARRSMPAGRILTDDFAPVERLHQSCTF